MLNNSNIKIESAGTNKGILADLKNFYSMSCKVEANGKVTKAGTVLSGDITNRDTAFKADASSAVGILLHDVDTTNSEQNAQVVIFGFIDISKVDDDVVATYTDAVKTSLNMIKFVR